MPNKQRNKDLITLMLQCFCAGMGMIGIGDATSRLGQNLGIVCIAFNVLFAIKTLRRLTAKVTPLPDVKAVEWSGTNIVSIRFTGFTSELHMAMIGGRTFRVNQIESSLQGYNTVSLEVMNLVTERQLEVTRLGGEPQFVSTEDITSFGGNGMVERLPPTVQPPIPETPKVEATLPQLDQPKRSRIQIEE